MSTDVARLRGNLKHLGLHAIADLFEREAQKAAKAKQSYVGFLDHLIDEGAGAEGRSLGQRADYSWPLPSCEDLGKVFSLRFSRPFLRR